MNASPAIAILSALLVGLACLHANVVGAPSWLAGNEAQLFLKTAAVLGLAVFAERMWRSSKR